MIDCSSKDHKKHGEIKKFDFFCIKHQEIISDMKGSKKNILTSKSESIKFCSHHLHPFHASRQLQSSHGLIDIH